MYNWCFCMNGLKLRKIHCAYEFNTITLQKLQLVHHYTTGIIKDQSVYNPAGFRIKAPGFSCYNIKYRCSCWKLKYAICTFQTDIRNIIYSNIIQLDDSCMMKIWDYNNVALIENIQLKNFIYSIPAYTLIRSKSKPFIQNPIYLNGPIFFDSAAFKYSLEGGCPSRSSSRFPSAPIAEQQVALFKLRQQETEH